MIHHFRGHQADSATKMGPRSDFVRGMSVRVMHSGGVNVREAFRRTPKAVPSADMLPVQAEPTLFYRVAKQVILKPIIHGVFRVKVEGLELLPAKQFVVVANHSCWWDGQLLLDTLPNYPRVHMLGDPSSVLRARTPKSWRPRHLMVAVQARFSWFLMKHAGGFIPVDRDIRGNQVLFDHVNRCLQTGGSVGLFPEAAYAYRKFEGEDGLLPFKKGAAHFAKGAGVPMVAITISGARQLWFRKRIEVKVVDVLDPASSSVEELTDAARQVIGDNLVQEPDQGRPGINRLRLGKNLPLFKSSEPAGPPPATLTDYHQKPTTARDLAG